MKDFYLIFCIDSNGLHITKRNDLVTSYFFPPTFNIMGRSFSRFLKSCISIFSLSLPLPPPVYSLLKSILADKLVCLRKSERNRNTLAYLHSKLSPDGGGIGHFLARVRVGPLNMGVDSSNMDSSGPPTVVSPSLAKSLSDLSGFFGITPTM